MFAEYETPRRFLDSHFSNNNLKCIANHVFRTFTLKENGGFCPKCHFKNFSCKISRDLLAYNLVMELEVSCNNVGKCPWIGHLSELVAHQNLCDKTLKILENIINKTNLIYDRNSN